MIVWRIRGKIIGTVLCCVRQLCKMIFHLSEQFLRMIGSFKFSFRVLSDRCLSVLSVTLVYCGQTVGWIKMKLVVQVGRGPGHIVLDGDPTPPQKKGATPQFLAHVYCGQMAGCIRIPLGTELGLSPGDIVLDRDSAAPSPKGHSPPIFGRCPLMMMMSGFVECVINNPQRHSVASIPPRCLGSISHPITSSPFPFPLLP